MAYLKPKTNEVPINFGVIVFPGFQALDAFGPLDALNTLAYDFPLNLSIIAETLEPVSTRAPNAPPPNSGNFSESILPTHTFETAPQLDGAIDFVAKVYPSLKYLITICTGAGIAARAGVLDDRSATTNKKHWATNIALRTQVKWIAHARWVVDGNIWTSSGVSAGLDVIFAFITDVYGKEAADMVADSLEYERHTDSSWDPYAELYNLKDSDAS